MNREQIASKCHDIQVSLREKEVPEFELLPRIGMMVNLSLHIRGLPIIEYDKLKLVSSHFFGIPSIIFKSLIQDLAEIEFVQLDIRGQTIKSVVPKVPFFENVYDRVGEYAKALNGFNEPEQIALKILSKLSEAPTEKSNLYNLGAEKKILERNLNIGLDGGYFVSKRARGKDIIISPIFFSENADVFSDLVAKAGTKKIQRILDLVKKSQGWPLALIEKNLKINEEEISQDDVNLLKRLAQDGVVKPPSINTPHSGSNHFIFSPAPGNSKLNPANREIYERAMALISSVRQGQLLAKNFPIRYPVSILKALKRNGYLSPTSEAVHQYHSLAVMRVGRLEPTKGGFYRFRMNDSEENTKALDLAIQLLESGNIRDMEIDEEARIALQKDQGYIDSILSSIKLRETQQVKLDEETKEELENLFIKGISND